MPLNISSTELQRALDSLLDQVNWLEVATDVAKNRAPFVYCNAIEKILLAHIYQLVKAENQDGKVSQLRSGKKDKVYIYGNKEENSEFGWNSKVDREFSIDSQDDYNMQTDNGKEDEEEEEDDDDCNSEFEEHEIEEYNSNNEH